MFNNSWFKKEMAMRGLSGFGGGATGLANAGGDAWEEAGITATGGTVHNGQKNDDGTPYTWHVFPGGPRGPESPTPYTFSVTGVTGPGKIEYIMVGGGGIGGISPNPDPGGNPYKGAGGGGAGGVICNFQSPPANPGSNHPFYPLSPGAMTVSASPGSYAIEVGRAAGGNPAPERMGKDTTFNGLTAKGGGYGGHANSGSPAGGGGSGGGGGAPPGDQAGAGPTSPTQGKSGGDGENASGGGGGGAESGGGGASGAGGEGIEFPDDGYFKLSVGGIADNPAAPGIKYLAGGGGGGAPSTTTGNPPGKGGFGGGGDANNPGNNPGSGGSADNWSGGGGGGAGGGTNTTPGGLGGQGMLFIRYVKNA